MDYVMVGIACLIVGWLIGQRHTAPTLTIAHLGGSNRIFLKGKLGDEDLTGKYEKVQPYPPQDNETELF